MPDAPLGRLLDPSEEKGICLLPIIAHAIFWPGAWPHLVQTEAFFVSGTRILFRRATIVGARDLTSLLQSFPEELAPIGPAIRVGSHRYILGLPKACADHITVRDWTFAEGLTDAKSEKYAKSRSPGSESCSGEESATPVPDGCSADGG